MTRITVYKTTNGDIFGFAADGHASDMEAGFDIYCAAVSAITQTACIGLEEVAKVKLQLKMRDGFLKAVIKKDDAVREDCRVIFKTLLLGLKSFDEANPGYIQINEEVQ